VGSLSHLVVRSVSKQTFTCLSPVVQYLQSSNRKVNVDMRSPSCSALCKNITVINVAYFSKTDFQIEFQEPALGGADVASALSFES
jgi:hypothetical protein